MSAPLRIAAPNAIAGVSSRANAAVTITATTSWYVPTTYAFATGHKHATRRPRT